MDCPYCYARRMYKRFKWNPEIRYEPDWDKPLYKTKPSQIFIGSTMELFGDWVLPQTLSDILHLISHLRQHTFIFLTKQPQNLIKWSPFPENCWVGVTATTWLQFSNALGYLATIKAKVRFLSFEPLLEQIQFDMLQKMLFPSVINWLIIGQQTPISAKTQPKIEWIQEIVKTADKANISVFLKNNLKSLLPEEEPFYTVIDEDPMMIPRLRQEFPK
jgi:protein gp37